MVDFNDPERYEYIDLTAGWVGGLLEFICAYCAFDAGALSPDYFPVKESETDDSMRCGACTAQLKGIFDRLRDVKSNG